MQEWLSGRGWSLDEAEVFLALLALLGGLLAVLRKVGYRQLWRGAELRFGFTERSYSAWFTRTWGRYDNPYLRQTEQLDLEYTYVSLAFRGEEAETRIEADEVLSDQRFGNIVIVGDPGSGKSTLLRAFGVGALRSGGRAARDRTRIQGPVLARTGRRRAGTRPANRPGVGSGRSRLLGPTGPAIPLLVPLRRFARVAGVAGAPGQSMVEFLIADILVSGWGRRRSDAEAFLHRALASGRAVILMDGLDEVPAERQEAVREAVRRFAEDHNPQMPTSRARLILTCRTQNFQTLGERWLYLVTDGVYTLAPLRDSEIFAYLRRLRGHFLDPEHGPEAFLHAIRASGTLDLHRTPLVLAMSVGLYAKKTSFEIPSEIADLYAQMITELLERQAFKSDPGTGLLRYTAADKARFLREFATANAGSGSASPPAAAAGSRPGSYGHPFGEFPRSAMDDFAAALAVRLDGVDRPAAFVDEIINRSGLVVAVGDDMLIFAHRSIQEYLVAEELRQFVAAGAEVLLDRVTDPVWRQVVLFYTGTARQSQTSVDAFLTRLSQLDLSLAGHCLTGAKATNVVACQILTALAERVRAGGPVAADLAAMLAATRSPRAHVRQFAVGLVRDLLGEVIGRRDVFEVLGGDREGVLQILNTLVVADPADIAELVPKVATAVPDDPRLVAPLWLALAAPEMAEQPGSARIVERLLVLAMQPEGLLELQRQEPNPPDFVTPELRRRVYPFRRGHPLDSNLVTLLCWSEHLGAVPIPTNRFLAASRTDPAAFARVETDRDRTQQLALYRPARVLSMLGPLAAGSVSGLLIATRWSALAGAAGWLILWWLLVPLVTVPVAFFSCAAWAGHRPDTSFAGRYLRAGAAPDTGRSGNAVAERLARTTGSGAQLVFLVSTVGYAIAPLPLWSVTPLGYLALAGTLNALFGWAPFLSACDQGTRWYLSQPNPYTDMYHDDRSASWLEPRARTPDRLVKPGSPAE